MTDRPRIAEDVTELVGRTPMVCLRLAEDRHDPVACSSPGIRAAASGPHRRGDDRRGRADGD